MSLFSEPKVKDLTVNPSLEALREFAKKDEVTTEFGSASYVTKVRSRSAKFTNNTLDTPLDEKTRNTLQEVRAYLEEKGDMLRIDRVMGELLKFHCRLYLSSDYARIGLGWASLLHSHPKPAGHPDFVTIYVPEWEEIRVVADPESGTTYVLGTDYTGEAKKSFLRQWMYNIKKRSGLGLHAGSKRLRLKKGNKEREVGQLYFGLSATGKSTLTGHGFFLKGRERAELVQDDVVALFSNGVATGTEGLGLYVKTEKLTLAEQPDIYASTTAPDAVLENVKVEKKTGKVDFFDTSLTGNGRASIRRNWMKNAADTIDLEKLNQLFFITRNPRMPAIVRLNPHQAGVSFMLGESVESSAGDPTKAGQSVRVVGTNPFIMGPPEEEGNRLVELLHRLPDVESFIINTGNVGEGKNAHNVTVRQTVDAVLKAARQAHTWKKVKEFGLEMPQEHLNTPLDPRTHYSKEELAKVLERLRAERKEWLAKFPGLDKEITGNLY